MSETLQGGDKVTPMQLLSTLSEEFFSTYTLAALETEADLESPEGVLVTNVVKNKRGTALGLAPLYMAAARIMGAPMRVVNVSSSVRSPP